MSWSDQDLLNLLPKVDTLSLEDSSKLTRAIMSSAFLRAADDGWFFCRFVHTRDESDPTNTVKPFPIGLRYLEALWDILEKEPRNVIAKSRQMLVSWAVATFCVWMARFRPNQAIYWQSQQWRDAVDMICMPTGGRLGRCQFIEENLPAWMRVPYKGSEGRIQYANGSLIEALAGGPDQIRGKVFSLYVGDEFARQEDQDGVYAAVAPLIQKGARAIFISTPNGSSNTFCTLYHGRPISDYSQTRT